MIDGLIDVAEWLVLGLVVVAEAGLVYVGVIWYGADNDLPYWWKLFGLGVAMFLVLHLGWWVA